MKKFQKYFIEGKEMGQLDSFNQVAAIQIDGQKFSDSMSLSHYNNNRLTTLN